MGKVFEIITPELKEWISRQKLFFVATAPLSTGGHINCSPKGLDSLRVTGPGTVVYQDLTGSGVETISHIRENGRIVIMFCAFEGPPKIVRLHGKGRVLIPGEPEFEAHLPLFPNRQGTRALIQVETDRISDSCGYGVPLYEFIKDRDQMAKWEANKGPEGIVTYQKEKNAFSIDGIRGL